MGNGITKGLFPALAAAAVASSVAALPAFAATLSVEPDESQTGASFVAYKLFDADVNDVGASNITWADGMEDVVAPALVLSGAGADDLGTAQQSADWFSAHIADRPTTSSSLLRSEETGIAVARALAASGRKPVELSGDSHSADVDEGYYVVLSKGGLAGMSPAFVAVGDEDVTVHEKTRVPSVDKGIADIGRAATFGAGEPIPFEVLGTVSGNVVSFEKYPYEIVDVANSLTVDKSTVRVSLIDGGQITEVKPTTVSYDCPKLSVSFADLKKTAKDAGHELTPDTKVLLEYSMSLAPGATLGAIGNTNMASIRYDRSPLLWSNGSGRPVDDDKVTVTTDETEKADVKVYTYQLQIYKVGSKGKPLSGARFTITKDGRYVQEDGTVGDDAHEFVTDDNGFFSVGRLGNGRYEVTETDAPDGYKKADPFTVTIGDNVDDVNKSGASLELTASVQGKDATLKGSPDVQTGDISVQVTDREIARNAAFIPIPHDMPQLGVAVATLWFVLAGVGVVAIVVGRKASKEDDD